MARLAGKVAIVTGAASGIGAATAREMTAEGAAVVVADLDRSGAAAVTKSIEDAGGRAVSCEVDVSDEPAVLAMIETATREFGRLDVLHNNAAVTAADHLARDRTVVDLDLDVWERTLAVNLRGVMLGCRHAIPVMLETGGGSIVNTSSVAALLGGPKFCAYGVSKGGICVLTRHVATAFGKQGIRCNAVLPGNVSTPGLTNTLTPEVRQVFLQNHLTPDISGPEDIAKAVVFLASDDARYVTGQAIAVDGGFAIHTPVFAQLSLLEEGRPAGA